MAASGGEVLSKASSYSTCIAAAVNGIPQRGVIHSVFQAAANIIFPGDFVLSLNAISSARMPNGLQLSASPGTFPFSVLRPTMPVLFGAQRLLLEAVDCSLDLSCCARWNPHIERPARLDMEIVQRNRAWLIWKTAGRGQAVAGRGQAIYLSPRQGSPTMLANGVGAMAQYLCGRGGGLTPTGDDILVGWMAINWLLYGPLPSLLEACQEIIAVARRQTHLLSLCWLAYAAEGNVAQPVGELLKAIAQDDQTRLAATTQEVLSMGATSGFDVVQGILLGLEQVPV